MTEPNFEAKNKFTTQIGVIEAELYDNGEIRFYREDEEEPYHTESFESQQDAEDEFFSLDSQVVEKLYEPDTEKYYTVETTVFHTVKADSRDEAVNLIGEMEADEFIAEMESPESHVVDVEEE